MSARSIRDMEITNLGKMIRDDLLRSATHHAKVIQIAEFLLRELFYRLPIP